MAGKHRQDEQEKARIFTQPQRRSKEYQQEGQSTANQHPEKAFFVHVGCCFRACLEAGFDSEKSQFFDETRRENRSLAVAK